MNQPQSEGPYPELLSEANIVDIFTQTLRAICNIIYNKGESKGNRSVLNLEGRGITIESVLDPSDAVLYITDTATDQTLTIIVSGRQVTFGVGEITTTAKCSKEILGVIYAVLQLVRELLPQYIAQINGHAQGDKE